MIPPTMQWSCLQLQTTNHCYCNVLDIATLWLFSMVFLSLIIPRACFKIWFELWIYNHILLWFFTVCRLKISWSSITIAKLLVYFQVNLQQHVTMSGTLPPCGSCLYMSIRMFTALFNILILFSICHICLDVHHSYVFI